MSACYHSPNPPPEAPPSMHVLPHGTFHWVVKAGLIVGAFVSHSNTRALLRARELAGPEVAACPQCYPTGGRAG